MTQVARKNTPSNAAVVLGAMSWAYRRVTGIVPPSFYSILLPTAQSALETASWKAMWNWNAGNITTANPDRDDWVDLGDLGQGQAAGLHFKAYPNLGAGCQDMLLFLAKRGVLNLATGGDTGAYTQGLANIGYAGKPGAPGSADYNQYANLLHSLAAQYANVKPIPYGPGLPWWAALGLGAAGVGVIVGGAYMLFPGAVGGLLNAAEENPAEEEEEEEAGAEPDADEPAARTSMTKPTDVQTLLFSRGDGWTRIKAQSWVRSHPAYHFGKVEVTDRYVRARQKAPSQFQKGSFRTVTFGKGIKAVVAKPV